ncbi:MAG: DUF5916 domain-containing protein [Owenweeksia sp.]
MRAFLFILFLISFCPAEAQQEKKILPAQKIEGTMLIDGILNEALWSGAPVARDFVMLNPGNGEPEPKGLKSRVRILYSDEALYVGAMLYDHHPDSILTQLTQRDDHNQNTDWFGIFINPFNDGLNDFNFIVTAAGVQTDSRTTPDGDDANWNSVWESAVQLTDSGWVCEMRIPYMALRFPEVQRKDWGLNMIRSIRRNRHQYSWNYINKNSGYSWEYQCGIMSGMNSIEPPVRLSFMPYLSSYYDNSDGQETYDFNAGLDLKYGINESFTLDMTVIPDFGQVAYDQQFVNLSPFENRFDENRQFFTEGTELFTIGDLFYSRRIGGAPKNITGQDLQDTTIVEIRQEYTRLLNATKISGRTNGNLGIGFLNAITDNNYSVTIDTSGEETRTLFEPLTNYNVLVLDQRINRNSSISFINTNVLRNGSAPDANVAGILGSMYSKNGVYKVDASLKRSDRIFNTSSQTGYEGALRFGDADGNWRWTLNEKLITADYEINDLGFLARNNQLRHYGEVEYVTFRPKGRYNSVNHKLYGVYSSLYEPFSYEEFYLGLNTFFLLRSFLAYGFNLEVSPVESYDYYEPRTFGRFFRKPETYAMSSFISTDYRKVFALDASVTYEHTHEFARDSYELLLEPRLRLGDHFFALGTIQLGQINNDRGYAAGSGGDIYFGQRDIRSITNAIDAKYVFNPRLSLSMALRHFWTGIDYEDFFTLNEDGTLQDRDVNVANDINFNTFNLDLKLSWWYAPGSEVVLLYRNVIAGTGNAVQRNYLENLDTVLNSPMQNNISIRLTYFLDYNSLRKGLR